MDPLLIRAKVEEVLENEKAKPESERAFLMIRTVEEWIILKESLKHRKKFVDIEGRVTDEYASTNVLGNFV